MTTSTKFGRGGDSFALLPAKPGGGALESPALFQPRIDLRCWAAAALFGALVWAAGLWGFS